MYNYKSFVSLQSKSAQLQQEEGFVIDTSESEVGSHLYSHVNIRQCNSFNLITFISCSL